MRHLGDQQEFLPTKHGFDHHFGLPYSNDMKKIPLPLLRDGKVIEAPAVQETLTARYTEEAVEFIKSCLRLSVWLEGKFPATERLMVSMSGLCCQARRRNRHARSIIISEALTWWR
jgi:hypothetical protein